MSKTQATLVRTYADAFGIWHAIVEGGTSHDRFAVAREAIVGELAIRGNCTRDYQPRLRAAQVSPTRYDVTETD